MEYIEKVLGLHVSRQTWEHLQKMPYYIQDRFNIERVSLGSMATLFVYPKAELDHMTALQKHIARIQKAENLPVVIVLPAISRYRRDAFVEMKIPFVVPEKQLYLPFIGTYMQERFDREEAKLEKFQPATQVLFFYYLYQGEKNMYMSGSVRDLGYSAMTISRAAKQLVQTGFFTESKDGVQKILTGTVQGRELFEKVRSALINPVRRRIVVKEADLNGQYILAGDSAMAKQTMLNDSMFRCYAVAGKQDMTELPYAMNADTDVNLELWKYDPVLLSRDGIVDPLSLAMSFEDEEDERVQEAIEELLDTLWEE